MKKTIPHGLICCCAGAALAFATALSAWAQSYVTFQVDMTSQSSAASVYINGSFNGWSAGPGNQLVNNGSGIYTNTLAITDAPGTYESCKFFYNPGADWESINNRQFVLGAGTLASPQVLPLQVWNVNTWPQPTNWVTFQVDMSAQIFLGDFVPGNPSDNITVSGDFEGWNNGFPLTNNPTLSGSASNIYSALCPVVAFLPETINYKFRMNGGWESPASTSGNNRQANITETSGQVLPLVYYNDDSIYDLMASNVTVTFTLYMPNGTLDDTGYAYDDTSDTIWLNADFLGNWDGGSWPGPIGNFPANQQMIEVGSTPYYTNSFVIPAGNSIYLNYKYAIDSQDDENGFQTNHVREVRSYGPTYNMPTDYWSWTALNQGKNPYPNPGITATNVVEPDFGYLTIQSPSAGAYPISWLGRPGVVLQNSANVTGAWSTNSATDGTEAATWPSTGSGNQFFRLMKKQ